MQPMDELLQTLVSSKRTPQADEVTHITKSLESMPDPRISAPGGESANSNDGLPGDTSLKMHESASDTKAAVSIADSNEDTKTSAVTGATALPRYTSQGLVQSDENSSQVQSNRERLARMRLVVRMTESDSESDVEEGGVALS